MERPENMHGEHDICDEPNCSRRVVDGTPLCMYHLKEATDVLRSLGL